MLSSAFLHGVCPDIFHLLKPGVRNVKELTKFSKNLIFILFYENLTAMNCAFDSEDDG